MVNIFSVLGITGTCASNGLSNIALRGTGLSNNMMVEKKFF